MKDMSIKFLRLDKENYDEVLNIKHILFPESNSDEDYEKYFNKDVKSNYYLITTNGIPCATIGWYDFDNTNKNAFVGWFGVLPEYQRNGIGRYAIRRIISEVKILGYDYLRVYTDKVVNFASTKLYDVEFDIVEDYTYPDKLGKTKNFVVYTKFLNNEKEKWNNRPLNEDDNYSF